MEQYIPKSALVAEIKKIQSKHNKKIYDYATTDHFWVFVADEDRKILSLIDTLETKEVDLNEEIESYFKGFGKFASVGIDDCIDIAKHFFELGLRAAQK